MKGQKRRETRCEPAIQLKSNEEERQIYFSSTSSSSLYALMFTDYSFFSRLGVKSEWKKLLGCKRETLVGTSPFSLRLHHIGIYHTVC